MTRYEQQLLSIYTRDVDYTPSLPQTNKTVMCLKFPSVFCCYSISLLSSLYKCFALLPHDGKPGETANQRSLHKEP